MRIEELMSQPAIVCRSDDTLRVPAERMWERDCGAIPVVDGAGRLVGIITDRDICMAAYTRGRTLDDLRVAEVMARDVIACRPDESIETAKIRMTEWQVRRIPVVDHDGTVVGVLSLNDLARHAVQAGRRRGGVDRLLVETLAAICAPREGEVPRH
jgi:predicted transcriptional regulator